MKFIDTSRIYIKSGDGGNGHISFRKEKFVPKGGPDGGTGGNGGNVIFVADPHLSTLLDFQYRKHFKAENGVNGGKKKCTGRTGEDLIIHVPCGTVLKEFLTGEVIHDITEPFVEVIIARGGRGGRGNCEFATPTKQTPRYAEPGEPGIEMELLLELKSIADVGIVGFPNSGKSTFISVVSAAKPKIADYPFTTLAPNLGIVKIDEGKSFAVADIPGLIEGASDGKGLGIQFLRHIERTKVLLFLLDCTSEDVKSDYKVLCKELKKYNPELLKKNKVIALSKCDVVDEKTALKFGKTVITKGIKPIPISSVSGLNIEEIKLNLWELLQLDKIEDTKND